MAYVAFDSSKPAGSQTGPTFATSANSNDTALWYAIVCGALPSWTFSKTDGTGTTEEPQYYKWTNGAQVLRATNTWTSGYITAQSWGVSQDTEGTWTTISNMTFTFDATTGALTATTTSGGVLGFIYYVMGRLKALWTAYTAHAAASNVHGMGTMATQNANAVNITGGVMGGTIEREAKIPLGTINGSQAIDWDLGGLFTVILNNASCAFTHTHLPSGKSGWVLLDILVTVAPTSAASLFPGVTWFGGTPTFGAGSRAMVSLLCHDGVTINGWKT